MLNLKKVGEKHKPFADLCFLIILVTRIQFLAIELARNRRGLNQFHLNEDKKTDNDVTSDKQTVEKDCTVTEEGAESKESHHAEESKDIECGEEAAQSSSSS